uniref:(northern house mosquito) hypothetical protein n=2 Tax=Culex pipiens TaxID=7175 RepID=A0A8D8FSD0_CULPI
MVMSLAGGSSPMKPKPGHINIPDRQTDIKFLIKKMFLHTARYRHNRHTDRQHYTSDPLRKTQFPVHGTIWMCQNQLVYIPQSVVPSPFPASPRSSTPLFRLLLTNHKIQPRWQHCNFVFVVVFLLFLG